MCLNREADNFLFSVGMTKLWSLLGIFIIKAQIFPYVITLFYHESFIVIFFFFNDYWPFATCLICTAPPPIHLSLIKSFVKRNVSCGCSQNHDNTHRKPSSKPL